MVWRDGVTRCYASYYLYRRQTRSAVGRFFAYFCWKEIQGMETLLVKVKSGQAAQLLADFLKTIDYVEAVASTSDEATTPAPALVVGTFSALEKPSDFAGIWKNRQKVDAKKLRKKA